MTQDWPTIRYREFSDVPRAVVVRWRDRLVLLDCPFDEDLDDYATNYAVYVLPVEWDTRLDDAGASWVALPSIGRRVGEVSVALVRFDATKRHSIDPAVFERIGL